MDIVGLDPSQLPRPCRWLLDHKTDMTSKLRDFFGDQIYLEVRHQVPRGQVLIREVTLRLNASGQPVEFGAIRIDLSELPGPAHGLVRQGNVPLGQVLNDLDIQFESRPSGFFLVKPDASMMKCFAITGPQVLYGRTCTLTRPDGGTLANVVEVLPPASFLESVSVSA